MLTFVGSISSAAWGTVCKRVLTSAEEIVKELLEPAPVAAGPVPVPAQEKEKPTAVIEELPVEHEGLD